ncbi:MAG: class I SAM-dependent methyltransferase, partial [Planctomycetota bacterium]
STERALAALAKLLAPGGAFLFYVYRKKGPVREFTDDFVRDLIASRPPEEAWAMMRPLTLLGKALSDLHATVNVPEDIPYLGIKAGEQDVQRLVYWSFLKLFWNERLSLDENVHVNFDWFHPRYAHRQTEEEVRRWCAEAGLAIEHFHEQESGFTVRAVACASSS